MNILLFKIYELEEKMNKSGLTPYPTRTKKLPADIYKVIMPKFECQIECKEYKVTKAPIVFKRFINHPLTQLSKWITKNNGTITLEEPE